MKKSRKGYFFLDFMAVLSFLLIIGLVGCEGPEGPAGPQGPQGEQGEQGPPGADGIDGVDGVDGADGIDMTSSACTSCHNDDAIVQKRFELEMHNHFLMPIGLGYAGARSGCARCHSHEGFRTFLQTGSDDVSGTVTSFNCKSCHTLHDDDNVGNFTYDVLVTDPPETLTDVDISFGQNVATNLCLQCHQPRRDLTAYDETPENGADSVSITSSHAGPHYGQMGSNLFGFGADDRNGSVALNQGAMAHATSANCVSCHMGENNDHNFAAVAGNCEPCHSGASDIDINGAATKMHDAIVLIEAELVARGWYSVDGDGLSSNASSSTPLNMSGPEFTAFWNYNIIHADHGAFYHNPPYAKAIINNIEENLGLTLTTW